MRFYSFEILDLASAYTQNRPKNILYMQFDFTEAPKRAGIMPIVLNQVFLSS
jgi:hypothetical protein